MNLIQCHPNLADLAKVGDRVFALIDLAIYQMLTFVTICYRCHTELRGAYRRTAPYFDLHIAEKLELEYSRRLAAR